MKKIHPTSMTRRFFPVLLVYLSLALASGGFAQTATSNTIPVVTIQATDDHGTWTGDPAVFTVFRSGNPAPALNVYCCISGTATNGVDYQAIGSFVSLPAGVTVQHHRHQPHQSGADGHPDGHGGFVPVAALDSGQLFHRLAQQRDGLHHAARVSNLPPAVSIINPTNGAVFYHAGQHLAAGHGPPTRMARSRTWNFLPAPPTWAGDCRSCLIRRA